MILSFSRNFPWDEPTNFKYKILAGTKNFTFRTGNRWEVDKKIHFYDGSPRAPLTPPANEFFLDRQMFTTKSQDSDHAIVCAIEWFFMKIDPIGEPIKVVKGRGKLYAEYQIQLTIGNLNIDTDDLMDYVARNDGFEKTLHFMWFFHLRMQADKKDSLSGQLIHWNEKFVIDPDKSVTNESF